MYVKDPVRQNPELLRKKRVEIVMVSFYQMTFCEDKKYQSFGVAYADPDVDLLLLPESGVRIDSWKSINLELRCGGYADYLSSDLGGRLCSEKLKRLD